MSKRGLPLYQQYNYRFLRSWNLRHWKNAWNSSSIHIILQFWRQK